LVIWKAQVEAIINKFVIFIAPSTFGRSFKTSLACRRTLLALISYLVIEKSSGAVSLVKITYEDSETILLGNHVCLSRGPSTNFYGVRRQITLRYIVSDQLNRGTQTLRSGLVLYKNRVKLPI
jgi:hypothetical protein